jgi:hypothetical protein
MPILNMRMVLKPAQARGCITVSSSRLALGSVIPSVMNQALRPSFLLEMVSAWKFVFFRLLSSLPERSLTTYTSRTEGDVKAVGIVDKLKIMR